MDDRCNASSSRSNPIYENIKKEILIDAPIARVWEHITTQKDCRLAHAQ